MKATINVSESGELSLSGKHSTRYSTQKRRLDQSVTDDHLEELEEYYEDELEKDIIKDRKERAKPEDEKKKSDGEDDDTDSDYSTDTDTDDEDAGDDMGDDDDAGDEDFEDEEW